MLAVTQSNHELALDRLPVHGHIPEWLEGTLVRNGPGSFTAGEQTMRHWFDGYAMLHKFSFARGQVNYASRFLDSAAYRDSRREGRITACEFATDPCRGLFRKAMTLFGRSSTDNAKISIARVADKAMALGETPMQVEFDLDTLRSVGVFMHEPELQGQMTTAHPHIDDEAMHNVVIRYNAVSRYRLYRTPHGGPPQRVGETPTLMPSYLHSFGLTARYAIIAAQPFVVNSAMLLLWLRPFIENFAWLPRLGTQFLVIDRATGELVGRYGADPVFLFHHVNSWERGDEIVTDVVGYDDAEIVQSFYLDRLQSANLRLPFGTLRRYTINLRTGRVRHEVLSDHCIELPRINDAEAGSVNCRHVYGVSVSPEHREGFYNQLVKIDSAGGPAATWHQPGCYPGEPVFVAAPGARAADDGVLLSVVLDAARQRSFLLVLDARTLGEVARAEAPQAIIHGFHGEWFPAPMAAGQRSAEAPARGSAILKGGS